MDELVQSVSSKTGLPADQARAAATATLDFVKGKLPAPIAGQIDGLLGGGAGSSTDATGGMMDQAKGMMGGLFGGKEENPS
jgi:hypothetical protein